MGKDKSPCLPPPSGRFSSSSSANASNSFNPNTSELNRFSHDISKMLVNPPKTLGHRRSQSEIVTLPDDVSFKTDIGIVEGGDEHSNSDEAEEDMVSMYLDMDKLNSSTCSVTSFQVGESSNSAAAAAAAAAAPAPVGVGAESGMLGGVNVSNGVGLKSRVRHQYSQSMDGLTSIKSEMLMSGSDELSPAELRKALSAAKLAELALVDPKRAKRIWANRQSAARSKERKMRYIAELERKLQNLQTESTAHSAQLSLLQRDTNGLTCENTELKVRVQSTEQQVHLQDALNDSLKEEIQHIKILTFQSMPMPNGGSMMNYASFGASQQYYPNNQGMHSLLAAQQFQQLQIQSQKHQQQQFAQHHQFQQQHQTAEMRAQGTMLSSNQKDASSDVSVTASKD